MFCGQGFPGPSASLHVFDRGTGRTVRLEVEAPELENSYYIYEVVWYDALQVLVRLMNRYDQQLSIRVKPCTFAPTTQKMIQQHTSRTKPLCRAKLTASVAVLVAASRPWRTSPSAAPRAGPA